MDDQKHDKTFFATFTVVIGVLVGITIAIMYIAALITPDATDKALALKKIEERIAPVGKIITDPAALLAAMPAAAARAPYSGAEVMAKACTGCHGSGVLGAPKTGDKAAWAKRSAAAGGLAGLVKSAIKGKNGMPARGGDASLSDDEIKAAVELMIK